ncbi:MAG TPA: hypothetical protein VMR50_07250 [Myxococcota bacterium]|nr:hypothetical protein [Myxococcota bacterium]
MPPIATVAAASYLGNVTTREAEEDEAARAIVWVLQTGLTHRGWQVSPVALDRAPFDADSERRFQVTEVQVAAEAAMRRVFREGASKQAGDFYGIRSVLPAAAALEQATGAQLILFAEYESVETRSDLNTPLYAGRVEIALFDVATGEVLYTGRGSKESSFGIDPAELTRAAVASLD